MGGVGQQPVSRLLVLLKRVAVWEGEKKELHADRVKLRLKAGGR